MQQKNRTKGRKASGSILLAVLKLNIDFTVFGITFYIDYFGC